jgi:hypothetical protein
MVPFFPEAFFNPKSPLRTSEPGDLRRRGAGRLRFLDPTAGYNKPANVIGHAL